MDIVVAMIGLAMLIIVAAYVAMPLLTRARVQASAEDSAREQLLAERDTLYAVIRDLDFDFQTGKLLEVDYKALREKYAARGVEILKELDAMPASHKPQVSRFASRRSDVGDEIEAAVQARRKTAPTQVAPVEDEIEAAVRARRKSPISNPNCPKCGRPIDSADKFCAKCGAPLVAEATR